jgi:lysophospholipase L1-like esterase
MNDALGMDWPETQRLAEHKAALAAQVRILQDAGIRAVILTVPPVDEMQPNHRSNHVLDMYALIQKDVAFLTGANLIDCRNALKAAAVNSKLAIFMPDGFHPSVDGHRVIAEAILDAWHIP